VVQDGLGSVRLEVDNDCKDPKVSTNQKWKGQGMFAAAANAVGVAPASAACGRTEL